MKRLLLPTAVALVLGGCSSEIDELKSFVRDSDKGLPRRIDPLPAVKPFEPFTYEGFDLPDPFKPRKLAPPKEGAAGGLAPDLKKVLDANSGLATSAWRWTGCGASSFRR